MVALLQLGLYVISLIPREATPEFRTQSCTQWFVPTNRYQESTQGMRRCRTMHCFLVTCHGAEYLLITST
jgi:hypothetical protein